MSQEDGKGAWVVLAFDLRPRRAGLCAPEEKWGSLNKRGQLLPAL